MVLAAACYAAAGILSRGFRPVPLAAGAAK